MFPGPTATIEKLKLFYAVIFIDKGPATYVGSKKLGFKHFKYVNDPKAKILHIEKRPFFFSNLIKCLFGENNDIYKQRLVGNRKDRSILKVFLSNHLLVKGSIGIKSDSSHDFLNKINKLYNNLPDYRIDGISYHDNIIQIFNLRYKIAHIIY